jgi:lipopolysaccharide exporter
MTSIHRRIASGAVWMVLMRLADRSIGFASTLLLARVLLPRDFGLVAMASSVIALVETFGAFGFDIVLIREKNPTPEQFNCAWTMNVLLGVVMPTTMVLLAWPLALFYHEPRLTLAIFVLAAGTFIGSLENIGTVEFRKHLNFNREFRFQITKRLITFVVTVTLALILRNYWALIGGMVTGRLIGTILSYRMHPFRPRLTLKGARSILNFSKWLVINNLLTFVKDRGSDFVVGRVSGSSALGLYNMGYELANLPTTDLVAPISRAVLPGYAQLAGDRSQLRQMFVSVISFTSLLAVPAGFGLAALAPLITPILLGPKWVGTVPVLQIVAFHGVIHSLQSNVYASYLAQGRPEVASRLGAWYVVVLLVLTAALTSQMGIVGAAYACLITAALLGPINIWVATRMLDLPLRHWIAGVWRPLVSAALMNAALTPVVAGFAAGMPGAPKAEPLLELALCVGIGAALYAAIIALLWLLSGKPAGAELMFLNRLLPRWMARPGSA